MTTTTTTYDFQKKNKKKNDVSPTTLGNKQLFVQVHLITIASNNRSNPNVRPHLSLERTD